MNKFSESTIKVLNKFYLFNKKQENNWHYLHTSYTLLWKFGASTFDVIIVSWLSDWA